MAFGAACARSVASLASAFALSAALAPAGCTFLVSFDDRADASCAGACDALADATFGPDAPDVFRLAPPNDVQVAVDAGECTVLSEGDPCAPASACTDPGTCHASACTAPTRVDGTPCGAEPEACHEARVCTGGVCGPSGTAKNGTTCGPATDACHEARVCVSGVCGASAARADGYALSKTNAHSVCCGGTVTDTTTPDNCGVCGWPCGSLPCREVDGEYFCTGCTENRECYGDCCSSTTENHCSPSNCDEACQNPDVCTGGSSCVEGATVRYCAY